MSDNVKKPYKKIAVAPISAAIWRNEHDGDAFYSVTFDRRYKDDSGNWKTSSSFAPGELMLLAKLADVAFTEIAEAQVKDSYGMQPED
jgi:hypothetical protein